MSSILTFLNRLLPFATPGTPIIQDLAHLVALCTLLYFAPQIQAHLQQHVASTTPAPNPDDVAPTPPIVALEPELDHLPGRNHDPAAAFHANDAPPPIPEPGLGFAQNDDDDDDDDDNNADDDEGNHPGPAHGMDAAAADGAAARPNVGAKKAKSLARRDQRRAYHEFMRSQGEAQRARDAEGAEEREKELAAERERRRAAEAALEAKKARERGKRRELERAEREEEHARREAVVKVVQKELGERRMSNLFDVAKVVGGDADDVWVENVLKASGVLRTVDGSVTMITSTGWVVRVTAEDMADVYRKAVEPGFCGGDGRVSYDTLAGLLEATLIGSEA